VTSSWSFILQLGGYYIQPVTFPF